MTNDEIRSDMETRAAAHEAGANVQSPPAAHLRQLLAGEENRARSIIRQAAEADPAYRPYCLRCPGLRRMEIVSPLYWRCRCGAEHDEREPGAASGGDVTPTDPAREAYLLALKIRGEYEVGDNEFGGDDGVPDYVNRLCYLLEFDVPALLGAPAAPQRGERRLETWEKFRARVERAEAEGAHLSPHDPGVFMPTSFAVALRKEIAAVLAGWAAPVQGSTPAGDGERLVRLLVAALVGLLDAYVPGWRKGREQWVIMRSENGIPEHWRRAISAAWSSPLSVRPAEPEPGAGEDAPAPAVPAVHPEEPSDPTFWERGATREERRAMDVEHAEAGRRFLAEISTPQEPSRREIFGAIEDAVLRAMGPEYLTERLGATWLAPSAPPALAGHTRCQVLADVWGDL